jgi:putative transposase
MLKLVRSIVSVLTRRFRSRAALQLENLALRHQLHVLRRQRRGRPRLLTMDRLLWVWLHRLWPRCLDAMILVKPATVIQWHRQGFRLYWRWRSRSGRPSVDRGVRRLIREMSSANPLWGGLQPVRRHLRSRYRKRSISNPSRSIAIRLALRLTSFLRFDSNSD